MALFPLGDKKEAYYRQGYKDIFNNTVWTGGYLYEAYKAVRDELRRIGKLIKGERSMTNICRISGEHAFLYIFNLKKLIFMQINITKY